MNIPRPSAAIHSIRDPITRSHYAIQSAIQIRDPIHHLNPLHPHYFWTHEPKTLRLG